ncbi:hypothetical protein [Pseudomonas grimontii]|uniref:hypothetical protein n=1 Tax=Pseudomonas grimontii TaxID=129847 RepID=UPI00216AAC84|nr:hypothetical protein [Pseudomonas grimontii]MCS3512552.1 DNA-directed RNA polymerase subunit RPC12/RpoP [Pseudomonas grimontii]
MTDIIKENAEDEENEPVRTYDFVRFIIAKRTEDYKCSQCGAGSWSVHNEASLTGGSSSSEGLDEDSPVIEFEHGIRGRDLVGISYGISCSNCGYLVLTQAAAVNTWVKENPQEDIHEK